MTSRPVSLPPAPRQSPDTQGNPDREYDDATETKPDHTRPCHDKVVSPDALPPEPTISIGNP